jgi:hypothetical protein
MVTKEFDGALLRSGDESFRLAMVNWREDLTTKIAHCSGPRSSALGGSKRASVGRSAAIPSGR